MEDSEHLNHTNREVGSALFYNNIIKQAAELYINKKTSFGWKIPGDGYYATPKTEFIYIIKDDGHDSSHTEGRGLKFHVSIAPDQFAEGLEIVKDIMKQYGILEAKFSNPLFTKGQESGKEICIYAFLEPDRPILNYSNTSAASWEVIIGDLTKHLYAAGIQPGALATEASGGGLIEQSILGTHYVSWRDDNPELSSNDYKKYITNFGTLGHHLHNELHREDILQKPRLNKDVHWKQREEAYQNIRKHYNLPEGIKPVFLTERPVRPVRSPHNNEIKHNPASEFPHHDNLKTSFPDRDNKSRTQPTPDETPPTAKAQTNKKKHFQALRAKLPTFSRAHGNQLDTPPTPPKKTSMQSTSSPTDIIHHDTTNLQPPHLRAQPYMQELNKKINRENAKSNPGNKPGGPKNN